MHPECLNSSYSTTRRVWKSETLDDAGASPSRVSSLCPAKQADLKGGLRTHGYRKRDPNVDGESPATSPAPLISVITVTFNAVAHLEQTIQSVIGQNYDNVEYIIVDGGSTDGTVDLIRKYGNVIDYWVSEPDRGIYDAMNKGILLASGDYITTLNAADWYGRDLLQAVTHQQTESAVDDGVILYSDFHLFLEDLKFAEKRKCTVEPWKGMTISHQAMFVGAGVYRRVGLYDTRYRLAADYDFFLRAYKMNIRFLHVDSDGVYFRSGGLSAANKVHTVREAARALRATFGSLSRHHLRYVTIEFFGLLYYRYFQRFLVRLMGKKAITAIRKMRRGISGGPAA